MSLFSFCLCFVYSLAGIAAFVTFLMLRYYPAAVFGFTTAAISGVTAHINWLHMRQRLSLWYEYNELAQLYWLGFWTFTLGTSGFVYHLTTLIIMQKYQMDLIVAAIWGLIALKSGAVLMYFANKYCRDHTRAAALLIVNQE